jgi:hypothetical protein
MPTSTPWRLAPSVHVTAIGEDLVFLDAASDAYICLPGGTADFALAADRATVEAADETLAADLAAAGLLQTQSLPSQRLGREPPALPTASAITHPAPRPTWRDPPQAAISVLDLLLHYRRRTFAQILAAAERPARGEAGKRPSAELLEAVRRFHGWIPYAPVSAKCLLRSFMLLRFLRRHGHDAQWVFGVTTWPFEAHCWLQCGDVVLDDHFERLWRYQPILAI